jgi:hypothetical protein
MKPKRQTDLQQKKVADDEIVFDPVTQKFHFLNETAAFVLNACNGEKTCEQIAAILTERYRVDGEHAREDVTAALNLFAREGLIVREEAKPA